MRRVEHEEGTQWLGGETHIPPYVREGRPPGLKHLLSRGMLLVALTGVAGLIVLPRLKHACQPHTDQAGDIDAYTASENRAVREQRLAEKSRSGGNEVDAREVLAIATAFGFGLAAGTMGTLLRAYESGMAVRSRFRRGLGAARKPLDETVGGAKEVLTAVGNGIGHSVKLTTSRVTRDLSSNKAR